MSGGKSSPCVKKEEQEKVLKALDARVYDHDDSRKAVQEKISEICATLRNNVDKLEEKVNQELEEKFVKEDKRLQSALDDLRKAAGQEDAIKKAKAEILVKQTYDVARSKETKLSRMYELETKKEQLKDVDMTEEQLMEAFNLRLDEHDENRKVVQEKNASICEKLKYHIDELEENINRASEDSFTEADNNIQEALNDLKMFMVPDKNDDDEDDDDGKDEIDKDHDKTLVELVRKAKHNLFIRQTYGLTKKKGVKLQNLYELEIKREVLSEWLEIITPVNLEVTKFSKGCIYLSFDHLTSDEEEILKDKGLEDAFEYEAILYRGSDESVSENVLCVNDIDRSTLSYVPDVFEAEATLSVKVRAVCQGRKGEWSEAARFGTPKFSSCCEWKECPENITKKGRYALDERNKRLARMMGELYCTVAGTASIPLYKITSWYVRIVDSREDNGNGIYIGVTPSEIGSSDWNYKSGWHFDCYSSTLRSGKPHNYNYKEYGPRKKSGEYVHTGDTVGLVMDAKRGELSFVLDGVNLGVAYEQIPLDRPLVPCVRFRNEGDRVELDTSEVVENVNNGMSVPSNVVAKSYTWDSITLTWDPVDGASYYQFEIDESKSCDTSLTNVYTKGNLFEDADYSFRVRAVKGNEVSEWSDVARARVLRKIFENTIWKECPENVDKDKKYSVDMINPRIATKVASQGSSSTWCTIVGNTPFPLNMVISWDIKLLNLKKNKGHEILVGVAPVDIDQNYDVNYEKCGWYFECYYSKLYAGPPDDVYVNKKYKPRKKKGKFVHTGDSVGVMMDTQKGNMSFFMNGINYGIAYGGIPLDKPLVPCVLLLWDGNSIELLNIKVETHEQYKKRNRSCIIS